MRLVFLSPLATNTQENEMFNLKKRLLVIRMAISSRVAKMQTTIPPGYVSKFQFPPSSRTFYVHKSMTSKNNLLLHLERNFFILKTILFQELLFIKLARMVINHPYKLTFCFFCLSQVIFEILLYLWLTSAVSIRVPFV